MPKNRGNPHISLRIPPHYIAGLKILSKRTGRSVGDLIREQIETLLYVNDLLNTNEEPIAGQVTANDLIDA